MPLSPTNGKSLNKSQTQKYGGVKTFWRQCKYFRQLRQGQNNDQFVSEMFQKSCKISLKYLRQLYFCWSKTHEAHCIRCIWVVFCPYQLTHIDTICWTNWRLSKRFHNHTTRWVRKLFSLHQTFVCWKSPGRKLSNFVSIQNQFNF